MSFTVQELKDAIEGEDTGYYGSSWYHLYGDNTIVVNGVSYDATEVDSYGGEGQGENLWVVFKVDNRLFRKSGWYASHDGYYWDGDLEEVEPFERVVTDYRAV